MGTSLNEKGELIVKRGGDDEQSQDDMLLLELIQRAPGMSPEDLQRCFVALLEEYGEDALHAIRSGHVKFEERAKEPPTIDNEPTE